MWFPQIFVNPFRSSNANVLDRADDLFSDPPGNGTRGEGRILSVLFALNVQRPQLIMRRLLPTGWERPVRPLKARNKGGGSRHGSVSAATSRRASR